MVITAETALKVKVALYNFPNWYPVSPTLMYHRTADEAVFYETSQTAYVKFIAAASKQLTLTPIPGGTHTTSIGPVVLDAITGK